MTPSQSITESLVRIPSLAGVDIPGTLAVASEERSVCILAHGIFVDRSENGRFDRLANRLGNLGVSTLRFDFSGHGTNSTPSLETTVARMTDDLAQVHAYVKGLGTREISIVASSFAGAVLALLCGNQYGPQFDRVVMLNPVLDFMRVFIEGQMPEMGEMFAGQRIASAFNTGYFAPVPHFEMSRGFLVELMTIDVAKAYRSFPRPHLVIHGTADELVSYEHTRHIVAANPLAQWISVEGAYHAFNTPDAESVAFSALADWIAP